MAIKYDSVWVFYDISINTQRKTYEWLLQAFVMDYETTTSSAKEYYSDHSVNPSSIHIIVVISLNNF